MRPLVEVAMGLATGSAALVLTAAGTSIGISLVPPLCAAGYGLALVFWRPSSHEVSVAVMYPNTAKP